METAPGVWIPTILCGSNGQHSFPVPKIKLPVPITINYTERRPMMTLIVAGRTINFLVSTGSDHSALNSFSGALSTQYCWVSGVLRRGKYWFTPPLQCVRDSVSFTHQFLSIPEHCTPVLGRDLLSRMGFIMFLKLGLLISSYEISTDKESESEEIDPEALVATRVQRKLWKDYLPGQPVTATPVQIVLKYHSQTMYQKQSPLDPKVRAGVQPLIDKFLKHRLLIPFKSFCSSPIRPVKKPDGEYHLVLDLRAVNKDLVPMNLIESKPSNILGEIPPDCAWFTVFNVSFCIPVDPASQFLFAFEWPDESGGTQQLTWTVLPQGFKYTNQYLAQALTRDLRDLTLDQGKVLKYCNDLLICSPTRKLATDHAIQTLNFFAKRGYKASRSKVQLVTQRVQYMGIILTPGKQRLSDERVQAISHLPQPTTKEQLRTFLGKMGFCRQWIVGYELKASVLYEALKRGNKRSCLSWGPDEEYAFEQLKQDLLRAPALDLPRMDKPFHLFTTEDKGIALGVLVQPLGSVRHLVGYLSGKLDPVAQGWPGCLRAMAATALLIEKASKLSLGQPLEVFSPHQLTTILESVAPYWLTGKRLVKYSDLMLKNPNVTLRTCGDLNPSSLLPVAGEGWLSSSVEMTDSSKKGDSVEYIQFLFERNM